MCLDGEPLKFYLAFVFPCGEHSTAMEDEQLRECSVGIQAQRLGVTGNLRQHAIRAGPRQKDAIGISRDRGVLASGDQRLRISFFRQKDL